jgi:phage baseplate assembly protein W
MAFGARRIFPIDQRPGTAVGVSIPFNAPGVFFSTYTTKDAIRNNLLNFFLTNKNERYLNVLFGADLRAFIFEQITNGSISKLENDINRYLQVYFADVIISDLNIIQDTDNNSITVQLIYSVKNAGVKDQIEITFD